MTIRVTINVGVAADLRARAESAARDASRVVFSQLNGRFLAAMNEPVWNWPRNLPTRKLKGATVREKLASYLAGDGIAPGFKRNIIDIGSLRQSYTFDLSGTTAEYRWTAAYAGYVHDGANIFPWGNRRRRVYLPPRPWTSAVLGTVRVDGITPYIPADEFERIFRRLLSRN